MSLPDTIFIFGLALVIFGPKKLPEMGRQLGKLLYEFRRASNEFKAQIEEELRAADEAERSNRAAIEVGLEDSAIPAATVTSSDSPKALESGSSDANTGVDAENPDSDGYSHGSDSSADTDSTDSEEDWDWDGYKDYSEETSEAETRAAEGESLASESMEEETTGSADDDTWDRGHRQWDRYGSTAEEAESSPSRAQDDSADQPFQWEGSIEPDRVEPAAEEPETEAENAFIHVSEGHASEDHAYEDHDPEETGEAVPEHASTFEATTPDGHSQPDGRVIDPHTEDDSGFSTRGEEPLSTDGIEQPETQTANHHA